MFTVSRHWCSFVSSYYGLIKFFIISNVFVVSYIILISNLFIVYNIFFLSKIIFLSNVFFAIVLMTLQRTYGSKQHILKPVELSQQIVSKPPAPSNSGPIYRFFGAANHADPLDGWRCS